MGVDARALGALLLAVVATLMISLAAGAVWMVLRLVFGPGSAWLALPLGMLLGWTLRSWVWPRRALAMVMAMLTLALAALYMRLLLAAAQIGASLGLAFREALHEAGPGMLLDVARISVGAGTLAWYLAGMALAAWVAARARNAGMR